MTIWTQLLRPLLHSPLQIHTPHLLRETVVWVLKPPFCFCQHALLGLYFFDNESWMTSLLRLNFLLGVLLLLVVSLEATLLESVQ